MSITRTSTLRVATNRAQQRLQESMAEFEALQEKASAALDRAWSIAGQIEGFDLVVEIGDAGALRVCVLEHVGGQPGDAPDLPPFSEGLEFGTVAVKLDSIIDLFTEFKGAKISESGSRQQLRAFGEELRRAAARVDAMLDAKG